MTPHNHQQQRGQGQRENCEDIFDQSVSSLLTPFFEAARRHARSHSHRQAPALAPYHSREDGKKKGQKRHKLGAKRPSQKLKLTSPTCVASLPCWTEAEPQECLPDAIGSFLNETSIWSELNFMEKEKKGSFTFAAPVLPSYTPAPRCSPATSFYNQLPVSPLVVPSGCSSSDGESTA